MILFLTDFGFYDDQVKKLILPKVKILRKDCFTNLWFSDKKLIVISGMGCGIPYTMSQVAACCAVLHAPCSMLLNFQIIANW